MNKVSSFRATLARFRDTPVHFSLIEQSTQDSRLAQNAIFIFCFIMACDYCAKISAMDENSTFHWITMTSTSEKIAQEGDQRPIRIGRL